MLKRLLSSALIVFMVQICIATLASAQEIYYMHPKPGSKLVPKETSIIIRVHNFDLLKTIDLGKSITIRGSKSGHHRVKFTLSDDERTLILTPFKIFLPGETVHVTYDLTDIAGVRSNYTFVISPMTSRIQRDPVLATETEVYSIRETVGHPVTINGVTVPGDFPDIETYQYKETAPGKIFFASTFGSLGNYIIICENDGTPYFYRKYPKGDLGSGEFKLQPGGVLSHYQYKYEHYITLDNHYNEVDTFKCKHGYITDSHEFLLTTDGHALMVAEDPQIIDMSQYIANGKTGATVWGNHIQEQDSNGNVVFEWRSWDYYDILDVIDGNPRAWDIDYVHMNSIAFDYDGHLVISARNLSEVTKINHDTGDIIWRLGGVNNEFQFINDPIGFVNQHHARPVPNKPNHYTIFDNGDAHGHAFSRAVEYLIDPVNKTAELVWEYRFSPTRYSNMMGSVQRLPNNNSFIDASNWPPGFAVEVNESGDLLFEMWVHGTSSYRTKRFEWQGIADAPYLIAEATDTFVMLLFNKFGDDNVDYYRVYGGFTSEPTELMAETKQSFIYLTELINSQNYYFRITAVDSNGLESAYSNTERVQVRFIPPGQNMVYNGDFSNGFEGWDWVLQNGNGDYEITQEGELHFMITDGGYEFWHIQAVHPGIQLVKGETYLLEFDAYADANRPIEVEVRKDGDPWTNYSRKGYTGLSRTKTHHSHEFEMTEPNELKARIVVNVGSSDHDVYIDNISLKRILDTSVENEHQESRSFRLHGNYPNPFNPATVIKYDISEKSRVTLKIFNLSGQEVKSIILDNLYPGSHCIEWDGTNNFQQPVSSGVYLYTLITNQGAVSSKMVLMR